MIKSLVTSQPNLATCCHKVLVHSCKNTVYFGATGANDLRPHLHLRPQHQDCAVEGGNGSSSGTVGGIGAGSWPTGRQEEEEDMAVICTKVLSPFS